ncbi:MAG: prenyltransferase/squalene oxidase repeat-containing protein, partial [Candidatus Zixiibacteriota bacterium]
MKPFETLSIIILIIFSLSTHAVVLAQPPEISSGLDYLKSIQKADGSWGGTETSLNGILPTTAHALTALSELEASVSPNQTNAIDFLQAQSIEVTQLLAERVIALAGAGVDVSGDVTALLGLQDTGSPLLAASPFEALFSGGGFGAAEGHSSNALDTSYALLALKAAGITDLDVPTRAVQFLMSQQNPDGGWGWLDQRESRLFLTALTVQALGALRSEFDVNHVLEPAVTFLRSKQNPDGGFGEQGSTAYETAMTLLAVFASGISATQAEIDGLDYLITTQQPNGSWADDAYSTALAVQALSKQAPNLIVVSINFSNLYPPEGEVVTVTATVQNLGVVDAENVVVHF